MLLSHYATQSNFSREIFLKEYEKNLDRTYRFLRGPYIWNFKANDAIFLHEEFSFSCISFSINSKMLQHLNIKLLRTWTYRLGGMLMSTRANVSLLAEGYF